MERYRYILILLFAALLCALSVTASEALTAKPEFTYNDMSLADYAGLDNQPEIVGKYAYAMNLNSGSVIYEKNSREAAFPASTVKLMTAIVAYENIESLDAEIVASEEAIRKTSGANVKIKAGSVYTAKELLNALLIEGANDAALVIADYVAGGEAEFCKLMNKKAKELGAVDTHYDNVTGFHVDSTVTTARDTGIIAQYFYYIPELFKMSNTTRNADCDKFRVLVNRNLLISRGYNDDYYYSAADGMSAGSTPEGGHCVVSTVTAADNQIYLCVVLGSEEKNNVNYAYKDIRKIFDFCRENFSYQTVSSTKNVVCELPVNNAVDVDHIALFPLEDVKMLLPNELDFSGDISIEQRVSVDSVDAPVNKLDEFGELVVKYKSETIIGRTKLVSDVSVDKSNVLYFISRVKSIVLSKWVVAFLIAATVLFGIYFGVSVYYAYFKKNKYTGNRPRRK